MRVIEGVAAAADEPFADPAALPLYELARQTRRYVTVVLSGDGGDETLAGYRRYVLDGWLRPYTLLPHVVTQRLVPSLAALIPEIWWLPEDRNHGSQAAEPVCNGQPQSITGAVGFLLQSAREVGGVY